MSHAEQRAGRSGEHDELYMAKAMGIIVYVQYVYRHVHHHVWTRSVEYIDECMGAVELQTCHADIYMDNGVLVG